MISFTEAVCEILPRLKPKEFFRPAQIDKYGNLNNVCIGDYDRPLIRLPGAAGIPDVTTYYTDIYIYVPNHSARVFVDELDFRSGAGFLAGETADERRAMGLMSTGPKKVITNLCVFKFQNKRITLDTVHLGVSFETVLEQTGFELKRPKRIKRTVPPTEKELRLIRNYIDPQSIRDIELMSGDARNRKIMEQFQRIP
jgi:glutaconate CoA-transferase subunit B